MGSSTIIYHGETDITTVTPYPEAGQASVSSLKTNLTSVSANTTLTTGMNTILVDATTGARVITLPDARKVKGIEYTVKKIGSGANAVTLTPVQNQTIDGEATYVMTAVSDFVTIKSDGTNWLIIDKFNATAATIATITSTTGNITTVNATTVNADTVDAETVEATTGTITTGNITTVNATTIDAGTVITDGFKPKLVSKTADYTATETDHTILCDATDAAIALTLPDVTTVTGLVYTIKRLNDGENAVTVTPHGEAGAETIDGENTYPLSAQYKYVTIQSDGTNWHIIANN